MGQGVSGSQGNCPNHSGPQSASSAGNSLPHAAQSFAYFLYTIRSKSLYSIRTSY